MKFERGYETSRERMKKNSNFSRSCFNCEYYYKGADDTEEMCQNQNVTKYDMVSENNNIYCIYWKQCGKEIKQEKKTGRARFEDL